MAGTSATTPARNKRQSSQANDAAERLFDRELEDLAPELRWRDWMLRVEALIDDLQEDLRDRPYELVSVAGGWQHRTRVRFGETIQASTAPTRSAATALSEFDAMVLMAVGYFQPVTRGELGKIFGKEVSRDLIGSLRGAGFISTGPRSPTPGAPYTYVTTKHFLSAFGLQTLRDLPDMEALEDAGLLNRTIVHEESITATGGEDEEWQSVET